MFVLQDQDLGAGIRVPNQIKRRRSIMTFMQFISNLHREESGQDLVEYALVLAAVATAVVAGSATLSADIANAMTTLNTKIQNALNGV